MPHLLLLPSPSLAASPCPRVPVSPWLLLLCLLLPLTAWAQMTYYTRQAESRHFGRHLPRGSDSVTCEQARQAATPKASINGGIACLAAGDTLKIGPGHYQELILAAYGSETTCHAGDAAVTSPCAILPNGLDVDHPTSLIGEGEAVISPTKALPGGGGIVTLYDRTRYLRLQGLRFLGSNVPGSAVGVHLGNAQYVAFLGNEVAGDSQQMTGSLLAGSGQSQYFTILGNQIHHAGQSCNPKVQTSPPCPHGMYLMGQHHVVMSNYVHHNANYAIQVSGEQGGISDVLVARNRVEYNGGVGIRLQGDRMQGIANQLISNGIGMTLTGNGLVAHNTFDGYNPEYEDPFHLWTDGGYTIVNNVFTRPKSAWLIMQRRSGGTFVPVDPAWAHSNGCDAGGNAGCTNVHPTDAWYVNVGSGDYALKADSPAKSAGASDTGVTADIQYATYQQPDLGAYAWQGTPPIPPEPPRPPQPTPGPGAMVCRGTVSAVPGALAMTCAPQETRNQ